MDGNPLSLGMWSLSHQFPTEESLLSLEPEELAVSLLLHLVNLPANERRRLHPTNHLLSLVKQYPHKREEVIQALTEAWAHLIRDGLLVADIEQGNNWMVLSRRASRMTTRDEVDRYRQASRLPREMLHPRVKKIVSAAIVRGEYDTAVFQAFREVEVAVREAAGLTSRDIGVPLMRKAFHTETGPLSDSTQDIAEREATLSLYAGAIGLFKNPRSHRNLMLTDSHEAFEMLLLASLLLRRLDSRKPTT